MDPVWYGLAAAAGAAIGFVVAILLTHSSNLETEKENVELRKNIKKLIDTIAAKDRRILNLERTRNNQMLTIEEFMKQKNSSVPAEFTGMAESMAK